MTRRRGGQRLIVITYDLISQLSGLKVSTLRQYVHEGRFDPRDLADVLLLINNQRTKRGMIPIGIPIDSSPPRQPTRQANAPPPSQPRPHAARSITLPSS
jgi:hypothetical protein